MRIALARLLITLATTAATAWAADVPKPAPTPAAPGVAKGASAAEKAVQSLPDALLARGHLGGELILQQQARRYYLVRHARTYPYLVVLHDNPAGEAILATRFGPPPPGDPNSRTLVIEDSEVRFFNEAVWPALRSHLPTLARVSVLHYHSQALLEPGRLSDRGPIARDRARGFEQALLRLNWTSPTPGPEGPRWQPDYQHTLSIVGFWYVPEFQQLSLDDALRVRQPRRESEKQLAAAVRARLLDEVRGTRAAQAAQASEWQAGRAERRPGLVYKNEAFWASLSADPMLRRLFEGDTQGLTDLLLFKVYHNDVLQAYSNRCADSMRKPRMELTRTIETSRRDRYGISHHEGTKKIVTVLEKAHVEAFKRYRDEVDHYHGMRTGAEAFEIARSALEEATRRPAQGNTQRAVQRVRDGAPIVQATKFIERTGCTSLAMRQLLENMERTAGDEPSLQRDGHRVGLTDPAAAESDPPDELPPATPASLAQACIAMHRGEGMEAPENWCQCQETQLKPVMTPEEAMRYSGDYPLLMVEVSQAHIPRGHRRWLLREAIDRCRR